jgi:hypothetical protein
MTKCFNDNEKKKYIQETVSSSSNDDSSSSDSDSSSGSDDSLNSDNNTEAELLKIVKKRYNKIINIGDENEKFAKLLELKYHINSKYYLSKIDIKIDEEVMALIHKKYKKFSNEYDRIKQIDDYTEIINELSQLEGEVIDLYNVWYGRDFDTETEINKEKIKNLRKKKQHFIEYHSNLIKKIHTKLKKRFRIRFYELKSRKKLIRYYNEMFAIRSYGSYISEANDDVFKNLWNEIDEYMEKNHHKYKEE